MQRKRILSALVAVMMILSMLPTFAFAATGITVTAANTEIYQGTTTAKVEIIVSENPGIAYLGFDVGYDSEKMTLASVETSSDVFASADFIAGDTSANPYSVLAANYTKNTSNNGKIITLNFNVNADCPAGTYAISLSAESMGAGAYTIDEDTIDMNLVSGSIKVSQKPITGVTFTDTEFTYDGTEKQITVKGTLPTGATVDYTANKGTDAGTYNATAVVKANGYEDLTLNAKMTIKPKNLTVSGLTAESKTYDGTTDAEVKGGTLSGKITGDDVDATFPTTGTFANANVGNNIAVSVADITLTGSKKGNYTLTQPTGLKANITKAPISVKANDITIIQGATIPALTYTITSGQLFGTDEITGAPATAANGTKLGAFDITKGTLAVSSNYNLTFTKGTLTVVDKTPQNITVSDITEKTYGDSSFVVAVTPDSTSQLTAFTFESSNTDVATVAADGTVTIKAAGETNITVKQAGNATYAAFTKTQKLVVKKVAITINADAKMKKVGAADPELTYQVVGELVNDDSITGSLARKPGEEIGQYDILIGTLAINNNYDITYNKAIFEIVDKTPQNITVSDITEKTYGDSSFVVTATPDTTSQLAEFTFESSNTDVAEIAADGTVTIKAAGETDITVKQAGNEEYAAFEKAQKLVVNKKAITITSINGDDKTSVLEGVLAEDTAVTLDYNKLNIEVTEAASETTSNVTFTNFALAGDKAANYTITTENVAAVMSNENIVAITITADNGTVTGAGKYIKGSSVIVTVTPNSGYNFSGWFVNDTSVSTETIYTFTADADTSLVAKFARRSSGGGGGSSYYTVKFDTDGGTTVSNQRIRRNAVAKAPEAPTKDGFTFEGWYTDKELTTAYDFDTKVTKSFTLYAKWNETRTEDDNKPGTSGHNCPSLKFSDLDITQWYHFDTDYVIENDIFRGTTETTFTPNGNITRAMMITVLYRAEGEPEVAGETTFEDIDENAYYANAVVWGQQNGIIKGYSETEYAPEQDILREQIAAIMHRYAQYKGYDVSVGENTNILSYGDFDSISEYAIPSMQWAVGSGMIKGRTESTLNPDAFATRVEIAAMLHRFIEANK